MANVILCGIGGGVSAPSQIKIDGVTYILNSDGTEYNINSSSEGIDDGVIVSNINKIPVVQ